MQKMTFGIFFLSYRSIGSNVNVYESVGDPKRKPVAHRRHADRLQEPQEDGNVFCLQPSVLAVLPVSLPSCPTNTHHFDLLDHIGALERPRKFGQHNSIGKTVAHLGHTKAGLLVQTALNPLQSLSDVTKVFVFRHDVAVPVGPIGVGDQPARWQWRGCERSRRSGGRQRGPGQAKSTRHA